jgi:hypothetical protein
VAYRAGRAAVCKNLQDVPEHASTIGIDWQSGGRADPDLPGSAAVGCHCLLPVTPEAAGSSPVDPANSLALLGRLRGRRPQARRRGLWQRPAGSSPGGQSAYLRITSRAYLVPTTSRYLLRSW